jgi:hypothetical protein
MYNYLIKPMSELHISIVNLFKQYYPSIDHTTLDNGILAILIENMFEVEKSKYSDTDSESDSESISNPVIEENYAVATQLIPNQIDSGDMICIQGRINQVQVNVLFDSGCQTSTTFVSTVKKTCLEHLVDKKSRTYCNGINGVTKTYGMIWCTQLELKSNPETNKYTSVPIKLSVIPDNSTKESNPNQIDVLIGTDFMKATNTIINFSKKTIGLNGLELHY